MKTNHLLQPIGTQIRDGANEAFTATTMAARDILDTARTKAADLYGTARTQADQTAKLTGKYVRRHPMPSLLGAAALGASLGCLAVLALRRPPPPGFRRHYVEEPLDTARDALYTLLAPVVQRLQNSCDTTRDGAGRALEGVHRFRSARAMDAIAGQLHRAAASLKFW